MLSLSLRVLSIDGITATGATTALDGSFVTRPGDGEQ